MGMLLNKYQLAQFKEDWYELTTKELESKYLETRHMIYDLARNLGLPKRGKSWWPRSKEQKFKSMYGMKCKEDIMAELEISEYIYYLTVKRLGLKLTCKI
jgi:hypothetical protein